MMRSLFLKMFLGFWLTVILVGLALEVSTFMILAGERRLNARAMATLPAESKGAAEAFDHLGRPALVSYLRELEQRESVRAYFLDAGGRPLGERAPTAGVLDLASTATLDRPIPRGRDANAAQRALGPSGRQYVLVLSFPRTPLDAMWRTVDTSHMLSLLGIVFLGGLFCLWLTRHVTAPLGHLRAAASRIAGGQFDTRVEPTVTARHDEIALLGRDFNVMAERIESLITAERQLLGDVSHALRSPLARLNLALGLARQSPPEEAGELLDRIELEAGRLDTLIGQLLTLVRIETAVDAGPGAAFDLAELVQELAVDGGFEGRTRAVAVRVLSVAPCSMRGSGDLMRSAIENVIRNAIRHAPASTTVEIALQVRSGGRASRAVLSVRDYGPGVPDGMLREIFRPFRRAEADVNGAAGGAGLGLAITERVVRMHGGEVRATNATGGGLVMELEMPIVESADAERAAGRVEAGRSSLVQKPVS